MMTIYSAELKITINLFNHCPGNWRGKSLREGFLQKLSYLVKG